MPARIFSKHRVVLFGILTVACLAAAPLLAAQPAFEPLGSLPGGTDLSRAYAVSADGAAIVGYGNSDLGDEAFLWTDGAGMIGLKDIEGGMFGSAANGVSADGAVIVGHGTPSGFGAMPLATYWDADDIHEIGDLPGGAAESYALAVSADGAVIVGRSVYGLAATEIGAFRWTSAEGMVALGSLPNGEFSAAYGVNDDGTVIVGEAGNLDGMQAFRWTAAEGMVGLGDIGEPPYGSCAYDVSANGAVIAGAVNNAGAMSPAMWTAEDGWTLLGSLPGGDGSGYATAISADGTVIVGNASSTSGFEAFVWCERTGMVALKQWLVDQGVAEVDGWALSLANDISANGTIVVGSGLPEGAGEMRAWMANLGGMFGGITGDLDLDGDVDLSDLATLLAHYGMTGAEYRDGDLNGDGVVNISDLAALLGHYGETAD